MICEKKHHQLGSFQTTQGGRFFTQAEGNASGIMDLDLAMLSLDLAPLARWEPWGVFQAVGWLGTKVDPKKTSI